MGGRGVLLGILLLVVGGVVAWMTVGGGGGGLDSAGRAWLSRVDAERQREVPDAAACRELLRESLSLAGSEEVRELIRGRAWLEFLLGRSQRSLQVLEPVLDMDATPEDDALAARVLKVRHAETGDGAYAHRASHYAKAHFDAIGDVESLFLAWQMQVRREDDERRKELGAALQAAAPESPQARLAKALVAYPLREDKAARAGLVALAEEFPVLPEELDIALAVFEIEENATIGDGMERIERVLKTFPSSIVARTWGATGAMRQKNFDRAESWLGWLLDNHPTHRMAKVWKGLADQVARMKGG